MELVPNTFWTDFTIAEAFGVKAIRDTFTACQEWKNDVKMYTALTAILNFKCWYWYEQGNEELKELYGELFYKASDFGYEHFKGEELQYFWSTLD